MAIRGPFVVRRLSWFLLRFGWSHEAMQRRMKHQMSGAFAMHNLRRKPKKRKRG